MRRILLALGLVAGLGVPAGLLATGAAPTVAVPHHLSFAYPGNLQLPPRYLLAAPSSDTALAELFAGPDALLMAAVVSAQ